MRGKYLRIFYLSLFIVHSGISASPAATPDAGQLLREQQLQRQLPAQLPAPEGKKDQPAKPDSGAQVAVTGFKFSGYEGLVPESYLQALVADAIGKSLTFSELQGVAEAVTTWLKSEGWFLARAYLPKQDVTSGVIEIVIIQGKSDGTLSIKRSGQTRIAEKTLRSIAGEAVTSGRTFNDQKLEQQILLINDLPGVTAKASLSAGATPGTTGILLEISEVPLLTGAVWGDNHGNRYTGSWRGNGMLNVNDPFCYGDQLSILAVGSEGLVQGKVGYSFPVAANGIKSTISYTGMRYQLVGDQAFLDSTGQSHTVDAGFSYPLLRSRVINITSTLTYEYKNLTDSMSGADIHSKQLHSGTFSFNGENYDNVLGGALTTWNAGVTSGSMHDGITAGISRTAASYTRANAGLTRLQRLTKQTVLNLSWSSQQALDNLDSSEKFNLGGPGGVRAYPVGEASGDSGHLFNADLRYDLPLPQSWGLFQPYGFYDAGRITLHKQTWPNSVATATNQNSYWLQGTGAGLSYTYSPRFSLKALWAHTIGDNPGRSTGNADADGKSDRSRYWLQATVYF